MKKWILSLAIIFTQAAFALTQEQKDELYRYGKVTVYDDAGHTRGHYEVSFMPGTENIRHDAKEHWLKAADLMDDFLDRHDFWEKKFVGSFLDGIKYARKGVKEGIFAIPQDLKKTIEENHQITGFGSMASKLKNWIGFTCKVGGRVLLTVWGIGAGSIYALLTPAGHILYRPLVGGTSAIVAGTLWPVARFSWNGLAWVATKGDEIKEGDITVTFVPERWDHHESTTPEDDTTVAEGVASETPAPAVTQVN